MVLLDLPFQCLEHGGDFAEEAVPGEELGTKPLGRGAVDYEGVVAPQGGTVRRAADAINWVIGIGTWAADDKSYGKVFLPIQDLEKLRRRIDFGSKAKVFGKVLFISGDERGFGGQGNFKEADIIQIRQSLHRLCAKDPDRIMGDEIQDQVFLRNGEIFPEIISREHR